jgi:predicted enzyme related to lactoylglutathione lyase
MDFVNQIMHDKIYRTNVLQECKMKLARITIAVTRMPEMSDFYNAVFDANLSASAKSPLVRGTLAGFELVLCPNDIAQVVAEQNRKQLHFEVDDLNAILKRVQAANGKIINQDAHEIGVSDPDGNTIVFKQI